MIFRQAQGSTRLAAPTPTAVAPASISSSTSSAVRMVYQVAQAVKVPIIGMGGIASAEDALEFILAGATAVSIGTANFFNPYATVETVRGIEEYMRRHKVDDINSLIGAVR